MTSDRRHKIQELLARALEHDPDDRDAFLAGETRDDDSLRAEVDALIAERTCTRPPSDPAADPLIGRIVADRYRIDARIGEGGMGTVYRATQLNLKRTVALKVIRTQYLGNDTAVGRFEREAHAVASLKHPNIITIYDFGMSADIGMYIVMEYLAGRSLGRELAELKRLLPEQAIRLSQQIASALDAAHNAGVVHRDLKPENIFLETTTVGPVAKILDFGIAKLRPDLDPVDGSLTNTNSMIGTPRYMSPEQIEDLVVDGRSDVYSLGCVLYEMLTGRPPFLAAKLVGLVTQHMTRMPLPPSSRVPELSPEIDRVVLRALAKAPAVRFQSAAEFTRALAALERSASTEPRPVAAPAPAPRETAGSTVTELVGRATEMASLARRLDLAVAGECQLVLVSGPAGSGKSRIVDEFECVATERGVRVLHGRVAESDLGIPYAAYCEAIQEYVRSSKAGISAFTEFLPDLLALFPMLAEMTELGLARPDTTSATVEAVRESAGDQTSVFEVLARTFARIARDGPLVVFLEDLHAAAGSVRALQYLLSRLMPMPLLIVGTYRSSEIDNRHAITRLLEALRHERRFQAVPLEPFSLEEQQRFVELLLGGAAVSSELAASVHDATDGNPFFAKELVQSLVDGGQIAAGTDGVWAASGSAGELGGELPPTVRQAVMRRVGALPVDARDLLAIVSVLGRRFAFRDLELLVDETPDPDAIVERLLDAGFLVEDRSAGSEYLSFTSSALRESLYRTLSRGRRRGLHRAFAERLEARAAGRIDRVLPQLVHHYAQGDVGDKAVAHALRLARRSLAAWSAENAMRAARTALAFLDREGSDTALEGTARLLLASAHRMTGDYDEAIAELGGAVDAFTRAAQPGEALAAMVSAAEMAWEGRRIDATRKWVRRGVDAARARGDDERLATLLSLGATLESLRGEHDRARELLSEAERLRPAGNAGVDTLVGSTTTNPGLGRGADGADTGAFTAEQTLGGQRGALGTLRIPYHSVVHDLDPCSDPSDMHAGLVMTVFETLTHEGEGARIVPWLASAVESENGGARFRIRLRTGVKFHDGHELTARDVRHTFERVVGFPDRRWLLAAVRGADAFADGTAWSIEGIRVIADDELVVELDRPLAILPAILTHSALAVVPDGTTRIEGTWEDSCSGTGPFRVTRFLPGRRIDQEAHSEYWRAGLPRTDRVVHHLGLSQRDILDGYRSGRYSLAWHLAPADVEALRQDPDYGTHLFECPKLATYFVVMNANRGLLSDESLRRRLVASVDIERLVRTSYGATAIPARSLIPPGLLGYELPARSAHRGGSGTRAVDEAVVEAITIPGTNEALLDELFSAFEREGVRVTVSHALGDEIETACRAGRADMVISGWLGDYPDADAFAYPVLHSAAGFYGKYVGNAELDALCEAGRASPTRTRDTRSTARSSSCISSRALLMPFCHRQSYVFVQPEIDGVQLTLSPPFIAYEMLGLKTPGG